ncbi:HAD family hydrolase [Sphingosinicella humi]|uniref:phosphoglycolate phosphatase n=1 Tax=Allosphingosinicella humi TaxID=2068657 RepID=A0A2U2J0T5_9SPHN|nr:HAD family hydrolase [Sphingosinicella humi]PWG01949.1 haloacid dehalogenase [Sphingosinicella humi]
MAIEAIAFDCYGTLLQIHDRRHPYGTLAALSGGRLDPSPMIVPLELAGVVSTNKRSIEIDQAKLRALEADLAAELASVRPISGARETLRALRRRGYRLATASNLAPPYAEPLRRLVGGLVDVECLSFEIGAVKPSASFYAQLCSLLGCEPSEVLMVGDSLPNDRDAAMDAGLSARHIAAGDTISRALADLC